MLSRARHLRPTSSPSCGDIMHTCLLQPPTRSTDYSMWKPYNWGTCFNTTAQEEYIRQDCDTRLDLYSSSILGKNDSLHPSTYEALLDDAEFCRLTEAYTTLTAAMQAHDVPWFAGFGNILAIARSGVAVNPWDDDIDIVAEDIAFVKFVEVLPCSAFTRDKSRCKRWKLSENVTLAWKDWGMPFKVYSRDKTWPCVDIMTYTFDETSIEIPNEQIKRGHVKRFKMSKNHLYGGNDKLHTLTVDVNVSHVYGETVSVVIPAAYGVVSRYAYGDEVFDVCKTSFIHRGTCKKDCKKPAVNLVRKVEFPCCLLPDALRQGLYPIAKCHS